MLGLFAGMRGRKRRRRGGDDNDGPGHRGPNQGGHGIQQLEKKIGRLQERLEQKKARWGAPNATTAAATSGGAGVPPRFAVSTSPAAVAATAALPPVMPPYPAGTIPPATWDEAAYLKKHPDVARGVNGGTIPSGLWHYMVSGKKEGRELAGLGGFDLSTGSLLLGVGLGAAAFYAWKRFSR